jgi:hypothetical protein
MFDTAIEQKHRVLEIIEALHAPIVYHPGGWDDSASLKEMALAERFRMLDDGGWNKATDAEVCAYLMSASMCFPFDANWTHIYCYETGVIAPQIKDVADFIPAQLEPDEARQLEDLKFKIRESQRKHWKNDKEVAMAKGRKLVMEEFEPAQAGGQGNVLVGVIRGDADPFVKPVEGTLETVLPGVPAIITEAEAKWATAPKNPPYKEPVKVVGNGGKKAEELPLLGHQKKTAETQPPKDKPVEELPLVPTTAKKKEPAAVTTSVAAGGAAAEERIGPTEPNPAVGKITEGPHRVAAATAATGDFEYYLKDGRGPFADVQLAMDAMGVDKTNRPHHNRWDRLSTEYKDAIPRRIKGQAPPAAVAAATPPAAESTEPPLVAMAASKAAGGEGDDNRQEQNPAGGDKSASAEPAGAQPAAENSPGA